MHERLRMQLHDIREIENCWIEREREREKGGERQREHEGTLLSKFILSTVSEIINNF